MLAFLAYVIHRDQMKITYFLGIFSQELFYINALTLNFSSFYAFQGLKTEYQPFLAFIGYKDQIWILTCKYLNDLADNKK